METLEQFIGDNVGIPYSAFDCWDITKLFYRKVLNIDLGISTGITTPGNDDKYRKQVSNIIEIHKSKFLEVDTPEIGDIILFNIYGITAHVGVYVGNKKFIHSLRETGCVVQPLKIWERKIEGYFRWQEQDYTH